MNFEKGWPNTSDATLWAFGNRKPKKSRFFSVTRYTVLLRKMSATHLESTKKIPDDFLAPRNFENGPRNLSNSGGASGILKTIQNCIIL